MRNYLVFGLFVGIVSCTSSQNKVSGTQQEPKAYPKEWQLFSSAFKGDDTIPSVYTCDSTNISPPLSWNKISGYTKSYALIMDDPDAPHETWVHWVIYNIPPNDTALLAQTPTDSNLAGGIRQGVTSFRSIGYGGPCPPNGTHRYFFKLFALDTTFNLPCRTTGAKTLTEVMRGHILAEAQLMGYYMRKRKKNNE